MQKENDSSNNPRANYLDPSALRPGLIHSAEKVRFESVWNIEATTEDLLKSDGTYNSQIKLIDLKNIFANCLPKMGKEYITRHVLDRKHRLIACSTRRKRDPTGQPAKPATTPQISPANGLSRGKYTDPTTEPVKILEGWETVGGICVRPFYPQRFAEVVFLAVKNANQNKGKGKQIMRMMKEFMKKQGIMYFLTYADNHAIGFFQKLGFTKNITLAKGQYYDYIKHYTGSMLMECRIYQQIDYLHLDSLLQNHMNYVIRTIKKIRHDKMQGKKRKVHQGCNFWRKQLAVVLDEATNEADCPFSANEAAHYSAQFKRELKCDYVDQLWTKLKAGSGDPKAREKFGSIVEASHRPAIEAIVSKPQQYAFVDPSKIPGLKQLNLKIKPNTNPVFNPLHYRMLYIWKKIHQHTDAWPFRKPVDPKHAPGYFDVVKDPIDLQTIKQKIDGGKYQEGGWPAFEADFRRMIKNCQHFNAPSTPYHKMAGVLNQYWTELMKTDGV